VHQLICADYSDAVRVGDTISVSGQASVDRHGTLVGPDRVRDPGHAVEIEAIAARPRRALARLDRQARR
jgi:enamine deaminase RidA (YjgF/YER057c/UK114 family)